MKQVYLLLLFISSGAYAQKIEGQIFSASDFKPLQDIKVINVSQNKLTYSNEEGIFHITAKPNDSINFKSLFFEEKTIVYQDEHKNKVTVYLEEKTNMLDEVAVMGAVKFSLWVIKKSKTTNAL